MAFISTNDLADLGKDCLTSLFAPIVQVDNIDPSVLVADHLENFYATEAEELLALYSESMSSGPAGAESELCLEELLDDDVSKVYETIDYHESAQDAYDSQKTSLSPASARLYGHKKRASRNVKQASKQRRSGRPRVYYRTVKAELSFGDEDLAEVETFGWDQALKQWTSSDGTSVPDLDCYFRRRIVVSQGTHLQLRDVERHYRLVQLWIKRRGMKRMVHLRFNGYADWVGTRRGSHCVRMGLAGVRRALRGEMAPAKVTRT